MDSSLFVNYIDPAFVIGVMVGAGLVELLHIAKRHEEKDKKKKANESYDDTKKIFEQVF